MTRAAKICAQGDCGNVQPCAEHSREPWAGSMHRQRTLSGSAEQKRARFILNRDDTICHVCRYPGADQADHVIPLAHGGPDDQSNMAAIHAEPCHREKTEREARASREAAVR